VVADDEAGGLFFKRTKGGGKRRVSGMKSAWRKIYGPGADIEPGLAALI